jgi:hypothetical protein
MPVPAMPAVDDASAYPELMARIWEACYSEGLADPQQPLLRYEQARRRTAVLQTLKSVLPASTILYVGLSDERSIEPFLSSEWWRGRRGEPGAAFPDAASTAKAFAGFLRESWLMGADPWVADILEYEFTLIWGTAEVGAGDGRHRGLRWRPGMWAATSAYDVSDYVPRLRAGCQQFPWDIAALTVRPRPRPFATLSFPDADRIRRIHVRDASWEVIRGCHGGPGAPEGRASAPTRVAPEIETDILAKAISSGILIPAESP